MNLSRQTMRMCMNNCNAYVYEWLQWCISTHKRAHACSFVIALHACTYLHACICPLHNNWFVRHTLMVVCLTNQLGTMSITGREEQLLPRLVARVIQLVCLICMPYMYALYVCLIPLTCMPYAPYMYALYVCLIPLTCMPYAPYMYALYVCLIPLPYMPYMSVTDRPETTPLWTLFLIKLSLSVSLSGTPSSMNTDTSKTCRSDADDRRNGRGTDINTLAY